MTATEGGSTEVAGRAGGAPAEGRARRWRWSFGSGPAVARLYQRLFALVSLGAWLSLGAQVRVLIGSRGLLPVEALMRALHASPDVSWLDLPTVFWRWCSDGALTAGIVLGVVASLAALVGVAPRLCFLVSTALYLSFVSVGRDFLSFQWDNLLLECGLLSVFLPSNRKAPLVHFLFRLVLFKLYFESGVAKWQSPIRDWQDGSAMTYYYETAPLPTWLAFYAHHLPVWWHHLESRVTLVLELGVPFAIFGPRRTRLAAAGCFTLFQLANAATANYGFFCYLAIILGVFLLDDGDVERAGRRLGRTLPPVRWALALDRGTRLPPAAPGRAPIVTWAGRLGAALLVVLSLLDGLETFADENALGEVGRPLTAFADRFRLVSTYHLFGSITRERIEPELQTLDGPSPDGGDDEAGDGAWTPRELWHKAGDVHRAPDFVAPHQPRLDFQLWFYGLSFRRREPAYIATLLQRMCEDPPAVQPLFRAPLPAHPGGVRLVFWRYRFATPAEKRAAGLWWSRDRVAATRAIPCASAAR